MFDEKWKMVDEDGINLLAEDSWNEITTSKENISFTEEQRKEIDLRFNKYQNRLREGRSWDVVREDIKFKL